MTQIRVSLVDVYVIRIGSAEALELLALRRAAGGRCPGSWETVHGHIDHGEQPVAAAVRELREETGLVPSRLYNLSRVDAFYLHDQDEVALIPAFAAVVDWEAGVTTGEEHDEFVWLDPLDARDRYAWPRERSAVMDVVSLLGSPTARAVHDVLAIDQSRWS